MASKGRGGEEGEGKDGEGWGHRVMGRAREEWG